MGKLNLLKWIYDLGYKKAEDRYYYALMEILRDRRLNSPNRYKKLNESDKEQEKRIADENRLFNELRVIIDGVFHPQEYIETQQHDRFLP